MSEAGSVEWAAEVAGSVLDRVSEAVVGHRKSLELVLAVVLSGGHVLLEDVPGLGKTLTARSLAQALGLRFRRVQFTPDLLPADVTGSYVWDQRDGRWDFRAGPVFTELLLADEINRTPPRTQAALLEAMQERQVTVEGTTHALGAPWVVVATANPIEYEGTYQLPEAQLDRFSARVDFGYLDAGGERQVLLRRMHRQREEVEVAPVTDAAGLLAMQRVVEAVLVEHSVVDYVVALVRATRARPEVLVGSSPRGGLATMLCARAMAVIDGRPFVTPDDVKRVAPATLAHRLTLRPESWLSGVSATDVVRSVLDEVPVPDTDALPEHERADR